ncbi:nucleotidyltransferase family protein [Leptospira gomenensis]|uniref:Nucleotidyltransferase family protein n=1 Tax=Leptospira gomenensis TaxID=2484974 RepID=A0A5F1YEA9_9LEPT|nr:NTP transferase domain-containing protein [Leptospira gomenensis]TGK34386.1 nucleotidyltransferase family protein [Leptospira gomenensis]TGK37254.1 nucleotidyltransferase family protein [Leptospira gomenensis]TGK50941.1 nucleotidyltransferase family protein [Leptospira gomenensis]TGK56563.1 nucleotidyltransferase family protein [Leptospira gomenensis]
MKFFIPAAGFGTRMKELTRDLPKPLLPVNGIPLIYYALFQAWTQNAEAAVVNLHFYGDKIREELRNFKPFPLYFSEEKKEILGTAGGIRTGLERAGWMGETISLVNPDFLYFPEEGFKIVETPQTVSADCLLYLLPRPQNAGYTGLDLQGDRIRFGTGNFFYMGIGTLDSSVLEAIEPESFADLSLTFRLLSEKNRLAGIRFSGEAIDLGEKEYYVSLKNENFSSKLGGRWGEFLDLCGLSRKFQR